jgi:hypothetical protein
MSAEKLLFLPWLQEPIEAGVLTPAQAWSLGFEALMNPQGDWPKSLLPLAQRVSLFHLEGLPMQ